MPVKVLHLIKGLGPGGAEQLLLNQARAGSADTITVDVAYLVSWKNHLCDPLAQAGWTTRCLHSDRAWDLRWLLRLRKLLRAEAIDVVHGHSPLVSSMGRVVIRTLPKSRRPRSIYTEHNEWGRHRTLTRRLNRWTIGLEDHVIAVSDAVKQSMPPDLDVEVLHHGIEIETIAAQTIHRNQVRAELGIDADEVVIGIVANFRKEKAYDVLLDAAAKVIADDPEIRFVSVGQGPLEEDVRAQHARLALGDRFHILGYQQDATRIMSAFDIFTLASHHEGLPVALMEALALDLPVVATTVGGIGDAVDHDRAILVNPGDAAQLAAAYLEMADRVRAGLPPSQGALAFDARNVASQLAHRYVELSSR